LHQIIEAELEDKFKNINIILIDRTISVSVSKKGKVLVSEHADRANRDGIAYDHDKYKQYILCEGNDIPPLRDLGIFNDNNRIVKSKSDKFKQINRFVEIIDDEFKSFGGDRLRILDFGCGKSYLTFIVYYYFKFIRKINVSIVGYDLKESVVSGCNAIAGKYGYADLTFVVGDVSDICIDNSVDMIITLHACDTATDYAMFAAIANNVKHLFSVPCCQHEVNGQLQCSGEFSLLLKHGLIKERFAALMTDAIRCEILKSRGYEVDVIEFVDFSHTPKNLMIRAKKVKSVKMPADNASKLLTHFHSSQKLYELLHGGGK